jgi:DNA-binding MurR/RpiR family transcriptional regulator
VTAARQGSASVRIRAVLPTLQPSLRRVAEHIVDDPAHAAGLTVSELAQACDTSEATVIRFSKAVGYAGYPQLRLALAAEAGRAESSGRLVSTDIDPDDDLAQVVEKIAWADARAVEETASQLDVAVLAKVVDTLVAARRIDIYGVGASGFVAADFQQKLYRIGRVAFAWPDTHSALTSAALLGPDDVAVAISHSGATVDTIDALAEARAHGAATVAVTNVVGSPIAAVADHVLTTAARETTLRSGATASRLAQLTVVDCVFVGVAQRTYRETVAALERTRDAVSSRRAARRPSRRRTTLPRA